MGFDETQLAAVRDFGKVLVECGAVAQSNLSNTELVENSPEWAAIRDGAGRLRNALGGVLSLDPIVDFGRTSAPTASPLRNPPHQGEGTGTGDLLGSLLAILAAPNVASKQWIIRQYDHEVQGGSVLKPLVGVAEDGPGDAAVVRPVLNSRRGVVVSCGMNPRYGEFDTYHMATSAIDEAVRNCVAVGADPRRIAVLDNFCWGDCEKNETLGSLVRAAIACHDLSLELETPFVSGKDSLNNEFSFVDESGAKQTIAIPPSLLISALGQVDDVAKCVSMDLKQPGNLLFVVGVTREELGGSHYALVNNLIGGAVPTVDPPRAKATFAAIHAAIDAGLLASCHDCSEGGLAAAVAEMAFAGGYGVDADFDAAPVDGDVTPAGRLFSESNTRFVCEVTEANAAAFAQTLANIPHAKLGVVGHDDRVKIRVANETVVDATLAELKAAWQTPVMT
ncbi:MAG: hypothetical protein CMJ58_00910 [Planctomycetaceae bacterium]|nr:hypothetical protein [Planctomycetaceae bacterium]